MMRWKFSATRTTTGPVVTVQILLGTLGTDGDTVVLQFVLNGTAVVDEGAFEVIATIRSVGAAGVIEGSCTMIHNLDTTGFFTLPTFAAISNSGAFNLNRPNLIMGAFIQGNLSSTVTVEQMQAELINP